MYRNRTLNEAHVFKLFKAQFSIRPIINCRNHPTFNLSLLINFSLQPFVKLCPSYIQDSQNLLQKCENLLIPDDSYLFSCDFESLYSNIDLNLALDKLTEFMKDKLCSQEISLIGFHDILKLVFFNNVFIYNTFLIKSLLNK